MKVILGSRSPQRRELLGWLVGEAALISLPPQSSDELSFDGLNDKDEIAEQLIAVTQQKYRDVAEQIHDLAASEGESSESVLLCADTVVVANAGRNQQVVLGQPNEDDGGEQVTKWLSHHLSGRLHEVWTCFCVGQSDGMHQMTVHQEIVRTTVLLEKLDRDLIDWYVSTGEFRGKAGGYAIQGQASVFVREVRGSLTNVIGLPLFEVFQVLKRLGLPLQNGGNR